MTGSTATILLILLALEGLTILRVQSLLTLHVFVGMLLIPPILLKMGSTTWRFVKYYAHSPSYRRKGPPPPALRVLGPFVMALTIVLFASGVVLIVGPHSLRASMLQLHQASFILWFFVMAVHVLGHLGETYRLTTRDWFARGRHKVSGVTSRRMIIFVSLVAGTALAMLTISHIGTWTGLGG